MADPTVIGRGTFVRGRVTGTGDLEIQGRVEGDVTCSGEVTIDGSGLVGANVSARRIVVRGAVKGDLTADDLLSIESGARVVGDLKAPRIAIAQGGLVRGHVQIGGGAPRPRASSTNVASKAAPPKPAAKPAAPPPPPPKSVPKIASKSNGPAHRGAALAGARLGPPPPVVPALKKGTKAIQKKR